MPYVNLEEWEAIRDCFENNWITEGPKSKELIKRICDITETKYGVFRSSQIK